MKSMLKSLMSVAAAALALTSCSTDATEEVILKGEPKTLEVNATIDQTRTVMAANHVNLEWSGDEEIYLYIGEKAAKADVKKINPVSGGTITGVTYEEGDYVYANYSIGNSYSNGVKEAEIYIVDEQTQTAANVFAGTNLPMTAKGKIKDGKVDLTFKPFGCVLVFNVYGSAGNEKIQSIKFETSVKCCGYDMCDLTAEPLTYTAKGKNFVTVTLDTPAAIGTAKPEDTKIGENQVYLVVAPFNYTAATITVTTEAGKTYTFKTANGIDCSTNSARVVNLNLAKAAEMQPSIEVPTVPQQLAEGGDFPIVGIVFKNIAPTEIAGADVRVYSDEALTQVFDNSWITFNGSPNATLSSGQLNCNIAANETTENRTAYIGIKCGDVQAAIAVTQVGKGASTAKYFVKVTKDLKDWTGDYLIVYEGTDGAKALDGALTKIDVSGNVISIDITQQGILSDKATDASLVKISEIEGSTDKYKYVLQTSSNYYLYSSNNSKNTLDSSTGYSDATKHPNSISIKDGSVTIQSKTTSKVLRFNNGTNSGNRFRYYKSTSTDSNLKSIQLYKLQ